LADDETLLVSITLECHDLGRGVTLDCPQGSLVSKARIREIIDDDNVVGASSPQLISKAPVAGVGASAGIPQRELAVQPCHKRKGVEVPVSATTTETNRAGVEHDAISATHIHDNQTGAGEVDRRRRALRRRELVCLCQLVSAHQP
jgi:hypothetical protein